MHLGADASESMMKRPIPVTVISCLLAAAGLLGLIYHLSDFKPQHPFQYEIVWIAFVRLLAIVAGVFMFRGSNWARWLAMGWIACHVMISFLHSWQEVAFHAVIFVAFAYFLFLPQTTKYFRGTLQR
jgi:hypothetical protein